MSVPAARTRFPFERTRYEMLTSRLAKPGGGLRCLTRGADYHYYAERDEHVEASGVEDVSESHNGR